jgi:heme A synthase
MKLSRFAIYAWGALAYNLGVILWGAYVRASGSGAGCGSHWPLCDGEVIPLAPSAEKLVEYTHRVTSGLALVSVVVLLLWSRRAFPRGHSVRRGAIFSLAFIITEALLGAGLVLFELVAHNESIARVFSMSAHLVNTFMLVGALTLTAWWASGGRPLRFGPPLMSAGVLAAVISTLVIGVSGAVIALGDTLFFAQLSAGRSEADISPFVEALKQLRLVHPILAVLLSGYLLILAWQVRAHRPGVVSSRLAYLLTALVIMQLSAGMLNVYLKVPIAMQLIHLLLADLVWIGVVLIGATALAVPGSHGADVVVGSARPSAVRGQEAGVGG